jgi:hypothetical protein
VIQDFGDAGKGKKPRGAAMMAWWVLALWLSVMAVALWFFEARVPGIPWCSTGSP